MKKHALLFLMMPLSSAVAHADLPDWVGNCDGSEACQVTMGALASTASPFLLMSSTVAGLSANAKDEYVADVKEDATMYLIDGGGASALLQGEFDRIRFEHPETLNLSDSQIAEIILKAN